MTDKSHQKPTLVVGGTGETGRRVAERLRARGIPVRIGSPTADPPFDWEDDTTWPAAVRGMEHAFVSYYPDLAFPGGADRVRSFAQLAVREGIRRMVLLSGRNEPGAFLGEQAVQEYGAEWTVVRASFFAQDFSEAFWLDGVLGGELVFPAGNTAEPFIDAEDIADVAIAALTEDKHVGQVYEVTGPRLMTFAEAVDEIAEATGRDIPHVPISSDEYASAITEAGLPPDEAATYTDLFSTVLDGRSEYVADGVQRALGRPARDFRDYARDAAAAGVWDVTPERIAG